MNVNVGSLIIRPQTVLVHIQLIIVSLLGDHLISRTNDENRTFKAIVDSCTHFLIGALSYALTSNFSIKFAIICAFFASAIDVDHFISARSFSLKDATQLRQRPVLHCSTLPLALLLLYYQYNNSTFIKILFIAFSSHHVRDAWRRGLWFAPFGSTPPIPYTLYIILNCIIPLLFNLQFKPIGPIDIV